MKKLLIGTGIVIFLLIMLGVIYNIWEEQTYGPEQSFAFVNPGEETVSVTFQMKNTDNKYDEKYLFDIEVPPKKTIHEGIYQHTYLITTWDKDGNEIRKLNDYTVSLPEKKDNYYPIWFDVYGDYNYALVNVNFLYEGKSDFAEYMAKAVGTKKDVLVFEHLYKGDAPFIVPKRYIDHEFVYPGDSLPKEVAYGATVYCLLPFPAQLQTAPEIKQAIFSEIENLSFNKD